MFVQQLLHSDFWLVRDMGEDKVGVSSFILHFVRFDKNSFTNINNWEDHFGGVFRQVFFRRLVGGSSHLELDIGDFFILEVEALEGGLVSPDPKFSCRTASMANSVVKIKDSFSQ